MLTLLSIMAGSFALSMRRETAIIIGLKTNAQASAIAEAGIALAEMMMLNSDPEQRWQTDGRIYELSFAGARLRLRLLSEAGKIAINTADEAQLHQLLRHTGIDETKQQQLVDAILDWRDPDDVVRGSGAETAEYLAAGLRYAPANRPFQSIADLQRVLGIDETVFNWLEPLITVYSQQPVDLRKASQEVLLALDSEDPALKPTDSSEEQTLAQDPPDGTLARLNQGQPTGLGDNEAVTIVSEAMLPELGRALLKAVVAKSSAGSGPFQILDWQPHVESYGSLFSADRDELLDTDYAESRYDH